MILKKTNRYGDILHITLDKTCCSTKTSLKYKIPILVAQPSNISENNTILLILEINRFDFNILKTKLIKNNNKKLKTKVNKNKLK